MFKNQRLKIFALFLASILLAWLYFQISSPATPTIIIIISAGLAVAFIIPKHWEAYQQAECTREKMTRNLILDLLGLLLTMGAAMYAGRLAGGYFGIHAGFWIGLLAGFVGGFLAAWMVRSVWGKLVSGLA